MKHLSLVLLLSLSPSAARSAEPAKGIVSSGRFQLIELTQYRREYMIDTQTGRVWRNLCQTEPAANGSCPYYAWTLEDVEGVNVSAAQIKAAVAATKAKPD